MVLPDGMTQYGGTYAGHVSHAGHLLAPVASPWLLAHADLHIARLWVMPSVCGQQRPTVANCGQL
jgi:hypothetical protein